LVCILLNTHPAEVYWVILLRMRHKKQEALLALLEHQAARIMPAIAAKRVHTLHGFAWRCHISLISLAS
jgi:hypothetical protein